MSEFPFDKNRIIQGDPEEMMAMLPESSIPIIITSPPCWGNEKCGMTWAWYSDYLQYVQSWVKEVARILMPGRYCFWIIPDKIYTAPGEKGNLERQYSPIYSDSEEIARDHGLIPEFPIVWKNTKKNLVPSGSFPYPPTVIHESITSRICVWRKPGEPESYPEKTRRASRINRIDWHEYSQDIWEITFRPTHEYLDCFPETIAVRILTMWSYIGDLVLDPFMRGGPTATAAIKTCRNYLGFEILEHRCDLARSRCEVILEQPRLL